MDLDRGGIAWIDLDRPGMAVIEHVVDAKPSGHSERGRERIAQRLQLRGKNLGDRAGSDASSIHERTAGDADQLPSDADQARLLLRANIKSRKAWTINALLEKVARSVKGGLAREGFDTATATGSQQLGQPAPVVRKADGIAPRVRIGNPALAQERGHSERVANGTQRFRTDTP